MKQLQNRYKFLENVVKSHLFVNLIIKLNKQTQPNSSDISNLEADTENNPLPNHRQRLQRHINCL